MLIEFITEIRKKEKFKHILGMGSSSTENYESNDFNSFYKRMTCINILYQLYYINPTTKGASNMHRIAQILRSIKKLETVININGNFRRFSANIFHEKIRT